MNAINKVKKDRKTANIDLAADVESQTLGLVEVHLNKQAARL